MWLTALKRLYEAKVAENTAVIDTFLQKSVGVADHDDFMKTLKSRFDELVNVKLAIDEIDNIVKQTNKPEEKKKEK